MAGRPGRSLLSFSSLLLLPPPPRARETSKPASLSSSSGAGGAGAGDEPEPVGAGAGRRERRPPPPRDRTASSSSSGLLLARADGSRRARVVAMRVGRWWRRLRPGGCAWAACGRMDARGRRGRATAAATRAGRRGSAVGRRRGVRRESEMRVRVLDLDLGVWVRSSA